MRLNCCCDEETVMKALVLDFDGVISDSAPEAFVVALRTHVDLHPDSLFAQIAEHLLRSADIQLADIKHDPLYQHFLQLMPLGNRAEDYGVILSILEQGNEIENQAIYDRQRQSWSPTQLKRFHEHFYQVREAFFTAHPAVWRSLIGPYSKFVEILRHRADEVILAIATAKDRGSVTRLLRGFGIEDLFPEERLLDKETGISKAAHLQNLHQQLDLEYAQMTFMDDKVNHLDNVAPLGARCALATWGYNSDRERHLASQRGYLVCTLEDVEKRLFG
jgi:phosphoglycolate phosphatase-like HAD superfamily hydrolase